MAKNLGQKPDAIFVPKWGIIVDLSVIVKAKADAPYSTFENFTFFVFLHIMSIGKNYNSCDDVVDRYFERRLKEGVRKDSGPSGQN